MAAKVAVEQGLSDVNQALQNNGFEVVGMDAAGSCACCVISGQDMNMMGIADTYTQATVVNANGLTADEVVRQVQNAVQQTQ
jgi:hypothetical protein